MSGPRRSLDDYLTDRIGQFGSLGGVVRRIHIDEFGDEAAIHGVISFGASDQAVLHVFEHIVIEDDRPHRAKYGYRCSYDDDFLFRYDRDPLGHPEMPEHKHVAGTERRFEAGRVTLHDVADELWQHIAEREAEAADPPHQR